MGLDPEHSEKTGGRGLFPAREGEHYRQKENRGVGAGGGRKCLGLLENSP